MIDLLKEFVDQETALFDSIAKRLQSFDAQQKQSSVAAQIFAYWYDAYTAGIQALTFFRSVCQALEKGDVGSARSSLSLPPSLSTGTPQGDIRLCVYRLVVELLPSQLFKARMQQHNRRLLPLIMQLHTAYQGQPAAQADLDLIVSWIVTFPHAQDTASTGKKSLLGSVDTAIKLGIGFAAGRLI